MKARDHMWYSLVYNTLILGYGHGYSNGYSHGYNHGYNSGYSHSYNHGYKHGYIAMVISYNHGCAKSQYSMKMHGNDLPVEFPKAPQSATMLT